MNLRTKIIDLWSGRVPLSAAFWEFAVIYGIAVNIGATAVSLVAYATDAPGWLAGFFFVLPLLYYSFVTVAVWRSAASYRGSQIWSELARGGVIVLALSGVLL
jgi:hypothetical protein